MLPHPVAESTGESAAQDPPKSAMARLAELKNGLQRLLRRKPTTFEKAALDRCALLALRAEMAMLDPNADSNSIVRLSNVARRAQADFERIANITPKRRKQRDMRSVVREVAHVR